MHPLDLPTIFFIDNCTNPASILFFFKENTGKQHHKQTRLKTHVNQQKSIQDKYAYAHCLDECILNISLCILNFRILRCVYYYTG